MGIVDLYILKHSNLPTPKGNNVAIANFCLLFILYNAEKLFFYLQINIHRFLFEFNLILDGDIAGDIAGVGL